MKNISQDLYFLSPQYMAFDNVKIIIMTTTETLVQDSDLKGALEQTRVSQAKFLFPGQCCLSMLVSFFLKYLFT